jgi:hypothetical protein
VPSQIYVVETDERIGVVQFLPVKGGGTQISVNISYDDPNLSEAAKTRLGENHKWHIHDGGAGKSQADKAICSNDKTGAHYDPARVENTATCNTANATIQAATW